MRWIFILQSMMYLVRWLISRCSKSIGLLTKEELAQLLTELKDIYASAERGEFVIEEGVEDVHSQVELMLTRRLGDVGKKIHSGAFS